MTEDDWIAVREDAYSTARALGFALIGAVATQVSPQAIPASSTQASCVRTGAIGLAVMLMFMLGVF